MHPTDRLSADQCSLLADWVPDAVILDDLSWGLVDTVVLEVESSQGHLIVKAGGPSDVQIGRELRAHREWLRPWTTADRAPSLLYGDASARLLVTRYVPGVLLEGTPAQDDPATYLQVGELLAQLHSQSSSYDADWLDRARLRVERHLHGPHRIEPGIVRQVRAEIDAWHGGGARVVPTHGDWQPRNWLIDDGVVRVIDFGRANWRPPGEDLVRLARQDFARDPRLEAAFLEGYGCDPREPGLWRRALVGEAVGTAVWAFGVGDEDFEGLGHRMLHSLYPGTG